MSKVVEVNNDPHGTKAHPFGEGIGQALRSVHWATGRMAYLYLSPSAAATDAFFCFAALTGANIPLFTDDFGEGLVVNFQDQPLSASEPSGIDGHDNGDGSTLTIEELRATYSSWKGREDGLITPPDAPRNGHRNFAVFDFSNIRKRFGVKKITFDITAHVDTNGIPGVWALDMCLFSVKKKVDRFTLPRFDNGTATDGNNETITVNFSDTTIPDVEMHGNVFGAASANQDISPPRDRIVSAFVVQSRADIPTNATRSWSAEIDLVSGACTITGEFNQFAPQINW